MQLQVQLDGPVVLHLLQFSVDSMGREFDDKILSFQLFTVLKPAPLSAYHCLCHGCFERPMKECRFKCLIITVQFPCSAVKTGMSTYPPNIIWVDGKDIGPGISC